MCGCLLCSCVNRDREVGCVESMPLQWIWNTGGKTSAGISAYFLLQLTTAGFSEQSMYF